MTDALTLDGPSRLPADIGHCFGTERSVVGGRADGRVQFVSRAHAQQGDIRIASQRVVDALRGGQMRQDRLCMSVICTGGEIISWGLVGWHQDELVPRVGFIVAPSS